MSQANGWTFLTNHAVVLLMIWREPDLTVRGIAEHVGITERAVQRILAELQQAGYLMRTRVGRRSHYTINGEGSLRHESVAHVEVVKLLDALKQPA
jgi:DNA-binding MarR family transcriptional regulator